MSGSPVPSGPAATTQLWCFDGFPYLVTRVVPAMYHVILLHEDLSREEAESVVRGQVEANRLETCLVLARDRPLYVSPDGSAVPSGSIPGGGVIVADRLRQRRTFAVTCDLVARRQWLDSFLAARRRGGYMFGDLTGGAQGYLRGVRAAGGPSVERCPARSFLLSDLSRLAGTVSAAAHGARQHAHHGPLPVRQRQPLCRLWAAALRPQAERELLQRGRRPRLTSPRIQCVRTRVSLAVRSSKVRCCPDRSHACRSHAGWGGGFRAATPWSTWRA
jgi:hypothetical protein